MIWPLLRVESFACQVCTVMRALGICLEELLRAACLTQVSMPASQVGVLVPAVAPDGRVALPAGVGWGCILAIRRNRVLSTGSMLTKHIAA